DPAFCSEALLPAARQVQKFRDQQYVDLAHLGQLIAERAGDHAAAGEAREVAARLDPAAAGAGGAAPRGGPAPPPPPTSPPAPAAISPRNRGTAGDGPAERAAPANPARDARRSSGGIGAGEGAGAHGLSIYMPFMGAVSPAYARLDFANRCGWGRFLDAF